MVVVIAFCCAWQRVLRRTHCHTHSRHLSACQATSLDRRDKVSVISLTFVTFTDSEERTSGHYVCVVSVKHTSRRNTASRLVGAQIGADVSKDRNVFVFVVHLSTFLRLP
jgi:hypothetical protein